MVKLESTIAVLNKKLLSKETKELSERIILAIAILSFIVHLLFIQFADYLPFIDSSSELLKNPIAAIYTPFSFILLYEVYLLIYYLPRSITTYIAKQYEIISLIIIRRLFKDLSNLKLSSDWFNIKSDLQFTYDILASVVLFFLLFLFYRLNHNRKKIGQSAEITRSVSRFIQLKKIIGVFLVPILLGLALFTFGQWFYEAFFIGGNSIIVLKDVNNIFFDEFFTILIIVDVLLLLVSFYYTDTYHKVIRNSGFVISTILIRLSFSIDGLVNTLVIVFAVLFGLAILWIHNKYEKYIALSELSD
jgi:hypothetical protein